MGKNSGRKAFPINNNQKNGNRLIMIKTIFIILLITTLGVNYVSSQSIGFSYFFPKNGYFSNPVAPINFSLPIKFGKYFQTSLGIGLSNIGGMSMSGFPD